MRSFALIIATSFFIAAAVPLFFPAVSGQTNPINTYTISLAGETNNSRQQFSRNLILLPEVPIDVILTFHNVDTMDHTFTINDVNGTPKLNTGLVAPGVNITLNFTILSLTRIAYNGTQFTPEASAGGGITFYCVPHRGAGMLGSISLAGVAPPAAEKGILLRAYWIGIIGIAAMLAWVIISYFVIKSSSRHFTDHAEHIRKGLP